MWRYPTSSARRASSPVAIHVPNPSSGISTPDAIVTVGFSERLMRAPILHRACTSHPSGIRRGLRDPPTACRSLVWRRLLRTGGGEVASAGDGARYPVTHAHLDSQDLR